MMLAGGGDDIEATGKILGRYMGETGKTLQQMIRPGGGATALFDSAVEARRCGIDPDQFSSAMLGYGSSIGYSPLRDREKPSATGGGRAMRAAQPIIYFRHDFLTMPSRYIEAATVANERVR